MSMADYINNMKIVSFLCRGLESSLGEIQLLCKNRDMIMIQETWLSRNDSVFLNNISTEFLAGGVYAMDASNGILSGRPHVGLAILWRKSIASSQCFIVVCDEARMVGIIVKNECKKLLLLNVYLPYDGSNIDDYNFYLNKLCSSVYR